MLLKNPHLFYYSAPIGRLQLRLFTFTVKRINRKNALELKLLHFIKLIVTTCWINSTGFIPCLQILQYCAHFLNNHSTQLLGFKSSYCGYCEQFFICCGLRKVIIFIVFLILYLWLAIIDTRKILLNYLRGFENFKACYFLFWSYKIIHRQFSYV